MKAILLKSPGDVEQLEYSNIEKPDIGTGEVLVKVKAISINPVDVKTRAGKGMYGMINTPKPLILGWDIAGTVEQSESDLFKPGDEVFGMVNFPGHGKAYAEYLAAPANQLALKPSNVSFEQAAAATLVALTTWQAMKVRSNIRKGQKVLVHAASGGVGHIAVQIAKYLGAEVTGTSSTKNRDFVLGLGADSHLDYQGYDWSSHQHKYDFVLDTIGGDNFQRSIEVTKAGGTIISIPTSLDEQLTEKAKAKGVNSSFMLVQSNGKDMQQIASLLKEGNIDPYVSPDPYF